ncbi:MAG: hypothetical protein ACFCU1_04385 [Sumerlaeia bacterium]
MKKFIIIGVLVFLGMLQMLFKSRSVTLGPGVHVVDEPIQIPLKNERSFEVGAFTIQPVAEFQLEAKVLSRKRYYLDYSAKLSPVDLALGWGSMSDEAVLNDLKISQSDRFYRWYASTLPIPAREITTSSANMHLIPADPDVKKQILRAKEGEVIYLSGKLVNVSDSTGRTWNSSLTREDSGNGACEVIWVEEFRIIIPER